MGQAERAPAWVPPDTFASRLRILRDHMHLTVQEIAEKCEVPVPTWRKWEHGASPRGVERHAKRIAERTGVDLWWLLYGRESTSGYNPIVSFRGLRDFIQLPLVASLA